MKLTRKIFRSTYSFVRKYALVFIRSLQRYETLITIINLVAILLIVPWQNSLTRQHQLAVSDYRSIRLYSTLLRANDEYTYDLCQAGKRADTISKKDKTIFSMLKQNRLNLDAKLTANAAQISLTFGKKAKHEIDWFILKNNKMNWSKRNICDLNLYSGSRLLSWQEKFLKIMQNSM